MLLVPYCSTSWTMFVLMPVSIEAMTMTTRTPMTIPSTVRKLRNLCARTFSSAIRMVSAGISLSAAMLVFRQCDDRIQPRRFVSRIDTGEQTNAARNHQRQEDVTGSNGHRDGSHGGNKPRQTN